MKRKPNPFILKKFTYLGVDLANTNNNYNKTIKHSTKTKLASPQYTIL